MLFFFHHLRGKHEIVKSNIDVLVNIGLGDRAKDDALLVRDTCTILHTLNKTEEKVGRKYVENLSKKTSRKELRFSKVQNTCTILLDTRYVGWLNNIQPDIVRML